MSRRSLKLSLPGSFLGIRKSELHDLWDDLRYEKVNVKAASHRKLEAILGLDPDEDDLMIDSLSKWSVSLADRPSKRSPPRQIKPALRPC